LRNKKILIIGLILTSFASLYGEEKVSGSQNRTDWYIGTRLKSGIFTKNTGYHYFDYFAIFLDIKHRYIFSYLFGGIGIGLRWIEFCKDTYCDAVHLLFPFWISFNFIEFRLPLWKKNIKTLDHAAVFFSGANIDIPLYGIKIDELPFFIMVNYHLGFDIFWLTLGFDYERFIFEHDWQEIGLRFGCRFSW